MPTGAFQSHYWPGDGAGGGSSDASFYHHPYFVVGMFAPSLPRRWRKRLIHYKTLAWRKLIPRRVQVSILALRTIWGKDWAHAQAAVDWVATHPETKSPKTWRADQAARLASDPNITENFGRFYSAFDRLPSTLSRDKKALLIELAWTGRKYF